MKPNTALLVMDMQQGILGMYPHSSNILPSIKKAIEFARNNHIQVIFVRVGFREGIPEVGMNNSSFALIKERIVDLNQEEWMKIDASLAPLPNDLVVTKRRFSAFTGSDLEVILRANQIHHLVLTGISTSGVVLSTLREAADKDYKITVLSDACYDGDAEVHQVLVNKVFTRQAEVISTETWTKV